MKKLTLILIAIASVNVANAQLKVYSGGKVAVGNTGVTPTGLLEVCTSSSNAGCTRIAEATFTHYYNIGTETKPRWGIGRDYLASGQAAIGFGGGGTSTDLDIFIGRDGSGNLLFQTNSASSHNTRMTITSGGNVAIGTSSTSNAVEVASGNIFITKTSANNTLKIVRSANTLGASLNLSTSSTDDWIIGQRGVTSSDFRIYSYGTSSDVFCIQRSNGNVGIGTTGPGYQLELSANSAGKPTSSTWTISSDQRLKKDIVGFSDGLNVLRKINPIVYKYNGLAHTPANEQGIGIIAQEMQKIAPYTVKPITRILDQSEISTFPGEISTATITLDSTHTQQVTQGTVLGFDAHPLFFILINSVKQLDSVNNELQRQIAILKAAGQRSYQGTNGSSTNGVITTSSEQIATLYQNQPNPFNQITNIKCYVPSESKTASLMIFDMTGAIKKTVTISNKAEVNIAISAKEFIAGMYYYSLIIDGVEIDTKKMILTEQ